MIKQKEFDRLVEEFYELEKKVESIRNMMLILAEALNKTYSTLKEFLNDNKK